MDFDFAQAKAESRQIVHDALAVTAVYHDVTTPTTPITVRWHTKLARAGSLDGGFNAEIIEGIHRLVFNGPELLAARDGDGLDLKPQGIVTIAFPGGPTTQFSLESQEPPDGPVNVYWTVGQVQPGQVVAVPPDDDSVYLVADANTDFIAG